AWKSAWAGSFGQRTSPAITRLPRCRVLTAYRGRKPSFSREQFNTVLTLASQGTMNTSQIAKAVGLQRMAVARIRQNPADAERLLATWGRGEGHGWTSRCWERTRWPRALAGQPSKATTREPCKPISATRTSSTVRYTELSPTRFKDFELMR